MVNETMRRYIFLPLLAAAFAVQAQDTYMNERITNNSSDVIGTARYVGIGGALGALGADMSVISWNPAGIGLIRKNDISMTFGGTWGKSSISEENRGKGTVDQAGLVFNMKTGSEKCPYVNFAFNYQKKINFNHNFYADNGNLGGLSQMDQVAELTKYSDYDKWTYGEQPNLANLAWDNNYLDPSGQYNGLCDSPASNVYTHHTEGSLQSFDFNLSTNINNRAFLGLTVGVDNMRFRGYSWYGEEYFLGNDVIPRYDLYNDYSISGTGVNVKLGAIIRPIADSPFRFGVVVETPTWYRLKSSTLYSLRYFDDDYTNNPTDDHVYKTNEYESYLPFNIRSPWKFRTGIGSTIGSTFAWDVDYEFATYACTSMGYPKYEDEYDGSTSGNIKDADMNQVTRNNLKNTHTLRVGLEANATKNLAFRLGYNLSTSAYEKNISFDQYSIDSQAMNYATSTSYMRMGTTNILTLGMGYRTKSFYVDLAYKLRNQFADFYAFDTSFTNREPFASANSTLVGATIKPMSVDLTRHAITCTLGFKF